MSGPTDIRQWLFRMRSYTPVLPAILMVAWARPTPWSLAAGLTLAAAGEMLRLWGVSLAGSSTRVTGEVGAIELVTSGPFAHVRNPLYVGNMMLYLGLGIASNALFPWLQVLAGLWFVFQYRAIVSLEEEFLRGRFGEEYARYCAAVPRFVPRLAPYRGSGPQPALDWSRGFRSDRRSLQALVLIAAAIVVRGMF